MVSNANSSLIKLLPEMFKEISLFLEPSENLNFFRTCKKVLGRKEALKTYIPNYFSHFARRELVPLLPAAWPPSEETLQFAVGTAVQSLRLQDGVRALLLNAEARMPVIDELLSKGKFIRAIQVAYSMPRPLTDDISESQIEVVRKVFLNGVLPSQGLKKAERFALAVPDLSHRSELLAGVSQVHLFRGDREEAKRVANLTCKKQKSILFAYIAGRYLGEGQPKIAERLASTSVPDREQKVKLLQKISKAYIDVGNLVKAEKVAKTIPRGRTAHGFSEALAKIVEAYIELGKLGQAEKIAETIRPPDPFTVPFKAQCFKKLSGAYFTSGNLEEAGRCAQIVSKSYIASGNLEEAASNAQTIPDTFSRSDILQKIVGAYMELGELLKAEKIAETIPFLPSQSTAFQRIALIYAGSGHLSEAERVTDKIKSESIRFDTSQMLTEAYTYYQTRRNELS